MPRFYGNPGDGQHLGCGVLGGYTAVSKSPPHPRHPEWTVPRSYGGRQQLGCGVLGVSTAVTEKLPQTLCRDVNVLLSCSILFAMLTMLIRRMHKSSYGIDNGADVCLHVYVHSDLHTYAYFVCLYMLVCLYM